MDTAKFFTVICGFILIICLVLALTTLVVLRNALEENNRLRESVQTLAGNLDGCVNEWNQTLEEHTCPTLADKESENADFVRVCIRDVNGTVGIFTLNDELIYLTDIKTESLPPKARETLAKGIYVDSWQQLKALIRDYRA